MSLPSFGQTILRGLFTLATHALTDHTGIPGVGPPSGAAGGELAGTYPNPTVAATHSGSTHAGAAAAAVATHDGQADPHPGYRLESATIGTTDLANDAVTYAKLQDVTNTARLLGRATAGAGDVEEITLGTNLSFTGTALNAAGGAGPITAVKVTLTHAQILSLFSAPVTLVAAGGAGTVIRPVAVFVKIDASAGAYVSAQGPRLEVNGIAMSNSGTSTILTAATVNREFIDVPPSGIAALITTDVTNNNLVLKVASADPTGGNAANSGAVYLLYQVVTE